ncbi:MAG: cytochrome c [Nitrospinae bacterium]|nr:cytochrome c [Nitrospinota bacterium]
MKKVIDFLGLLVLFFILTGINSYKAYKDFPEPVPTSQGQKIFQEMGCPMCHGHQGLGNGFLAQGLEPKPRNFTSFQEMKGVPYQSMYTAIKDGIPFTGMPAFNLNDQQIDETISYVRSFLTENYITLNTCSNVSQVVSLENVGAGEQFEIEIDKKELISTQLKAGEITLTPNFDAVRSAYKEKKAKLVRVHVNLTQNTKEKKKYLAIIAVRINSCIK